VSDKFKLTPNIITPLDLGRVIREAEKLDDYLLQSGLRGHKTADSLPKVTRMLEEISEINGLSLLDGTHRKHLIGNLRSVRTSARKIHISFAVEPSPAVLKKIVAWFRQNIEEDLIVEIGVQPTISVGCVVRTTNKIFDMSLRHRFFDSKNQLSELLEKTK
jgi:F0F1-type ATP synthase delta subunit